MTLATGYGTVQRQAWIGETFHTASNSARYVALYLLTCPAGATEGFYRLPKGYAIADLRITEAEFDSALSELADFVSYDSQAGLVLLHNGLSRNDPPKGKPRIDGAVKSLRRLPPSPLWTTFLESAAVHAPEFHQAIIKAVNIEEKTSSEGMAYPMGNGMPEGMAYPMGNGMPEGMGKGMAYRRGGNEHEHEHLLATYDRSDTQEGYPQAGVVSSVVEDGQSPIEPAAVHAPEFHQAIIKAVNIEEKTSSEGMAYPMGNGMPEGMAYPMGNGMPEGMGKGMAYRRGGNEHEHEHLLATYDRSDTQEGYPQAGVVSSVVEDGQSPIEPAAVLAAIADALRITPTPDDPGLRRQTRAVLDQGWTPDAIAAALTASAPLQPDKTWGAWLVGALRRLAKESPDTVIDLTERRRPRTPAHPDDCAGGCAGSGLLGVGTAEVSKCPGNHHRTATGGRSA